MQYLPQTHSALTQRHPIGYRYQRSGGAGKGVFTFSDGFAESQARQANNTERQRKENEEYEKRKRELGSFI